MKLLELEIEHFGVFSGVQLQFTPSFSRLMVTRLFRQVNPAANDFCRSWFFGSLTRARYAFESHQAALAATGRVEMADGALCPIFRARAPRTRWPGNSTSSGETIDEHRLACMLSHAIAPVNPPCIKHVFTSWRPVKKAWLRRNLAERAPRRRTGRTGRHTTSTGSAAGGTRATVCAAGEKPRDQRAAAAGQTVIDEQLLCSMFKLC